MGVPCGPNFPVEVPDAGFGPHARGPHAGRPGWWLAARPGRAVGGGGRQGRGRTAVPGTGPREGRGLVSGPDLRQASEQATGRAKPDTSRS